MGTRKNRVEKDWDAPLLLKKSYSVCRIVHSQLIGIILGERERMRPRHDDGTFPSGGAHAQGFDQQRTRRRVKGAVCDGTHPRTCCWGGDIDGR